jgi:hypothetical protein
MPQYSLLIQCPQCLKYFSHETTHTYDDGSTQFPLHTCVIGGIPTPNTLVERVSVQWDMGDRAEIGERILGALDQLELLPDDEGEPF